MLRLSKLADYAVVLLARLGQEGGLHTAPSLSAATGIAEPTVAKVLRILSQASLVEAQRGARGGHRLARPISAIPLSDVIVAVDGPIALTACVDGNTGGCEVTCVGDCTVSCGGCRVLCDDPKGCEVTCANGGGMLCADGSTACNTGC